MSNSRYCLDKRADSPLEAKAPVGGVVFYSFESFHNFMWVVFEVSCWSAEILSYNLGCVIDPEFLGHSG